MAKEQKANDRIRLLIEVLAEAEGDAHQIGECIKAAQEMVRDGSLECQSVDRVRAMAARSVPPHNKLEGSKKVKTVTKTTKMVKSETRGARFMAWTLDDDLYEIINEKDVEKMAADCGASKMLIQSIQTSFECLRDAARTDLEGLHKRIEALEALEAGKMIATTDMPPTAGGKKVHWLDPRNEKYPVCGEGRKKDPLVTPDRAKVTCRCCKMTYLFSGDEAQY